VEYATAALQAGEEILAVFRCPSLPAEPIVAHAPVFYNQQFVIKTQKSSSGTRA
jgi:hypothetical protein